VTGDARHPDLALVTAAQMPVPDPESDLLVRALAEVGVDAVIRVWDEPCDWAAFRLVLCRTPWDYSLRPGEFLAWAGEVARRTTLLNPLATIIWNAHKSYLLDLERAGVPTVATIVIRRNAAAGVCEDALRRFPEFVIKPAISAGGRGALLASRDGERRAAAHLKSLLAGGDALVQPFIESIRHRGEASLVFFEGEFSHAVRKVPRGDEFRVHAYRGGVVQPHEPTDAELAVARGALAVAPTPTAYGRIDLVQGPDGPMVMEAECIEPQLFLDIAAELPARFARCLAQRVRAAAAHSYPS
jgi:glutathione synthase/RimK-type ligase-like ATP-grasp enzyme